MLEELRCTHCDAPLNPNTLKCEYCGSQYERKQDGGNTHYIQTCPAQIQTLKAQVQVSNEIVHIMGSADQISRHTLNEMSRVLADEVLKYAKIEHTYEPHTMTQIIRGTVRVVEPDFRF